MGFYVFNTKNYGFNDSFVTWVETLYNNIQTCVINNGWLSEIFKNTRGNSRIFFKR
jgi:nicotinamide mononucleotide adenylyltransferase